MNEDHKPERRKDYIKIEKTLEEKLDNFELRLRRFIIKVVAMFAFLGLTNALSVLYIASVSKNNRAGLCAVREDAESRAKQTRAFIKEHPEGFGGISAAVLRRSINVSSRTVNALKDISCEGEL